LDAAAARNRGAPLAREEYDGPRERLSVADTEDFDAFYQGSRQRLLGYVYVLTGDLGEAQDAVQEAFLRAWQRWHTIRAYDEPEAWVRLVACRIATSRWRSMRSRMRAHGRHGAGPDVATGPSTDTVDVVAALRRLPEEQRIAIALYYLVGLPVAEVARETAAPIGTVKARLSRGRKALADLLALDPMEPTAEGYHA
jgi:RNA polymerase sigma-70 factor (sigma-E family)